MDRKFWFIIICSIFVQFGFPNDEPDSLYKRFEHNDEILSQLKTFINKGYSKELDIKNLTSEKLVSGSKTYLGTPHCMGGVTKKCMDCSGLLFAVLKDFGIEIPHGSEEQARYGKMVIKMEDLEKGNLVFFINSYKTNKLITHAGIYMGNNLFIHTSSKKGVTITELKGNSYWEDKFIFGTRLF